MMFALTLPLGGRRMGGKAHDEGIVMYPWSGLGGRKLESSMARIKHVEIEHVEMH